MTIKCLNPFERDSNRVRVMAMPVVSIPMEPGLETFQSVRSWRYVHPVFPGNSARSFKNRRLNDSILIHGYLRY